MLVGPCYNLFRVKRQGYVCASYEVVLSSGSNGAIFLNLGMRCRRQFSFTPWLLYPGVNRPWDPLSRRLGGPQTWTGCFGETENLGIRKFYYNKGFWRMFTITVLIDFYFSYVCSVYKVIFRSFIYSIVCLQYFQVNIVCTCCDIEWDLSSFLLCVLSTRASSHCVWR